MKEFTTTIKFKIFSSSFSISYLANDLLGDVHCVGHCGRISLHTQTHLSKHVQLPPPFAQTVKGLQCLAK